MKHKKTFFQNTLKTIWLLCLVGLPMFCFAQTQEAQGLSEVQKERLEAKEKWKEQKGQKTKSPSERTIKIKTVKAQPKNKNSIGNAPKKQSNSLSLSKASNSKIDRVAYLNQYFNTCNKKLLVLKSNVQPNSMELKEIQQLEEKIEVLCRQFEKLDCDN